MEQNITLQRIPKAPPLLVEIMAEGFRAQLFLIKDVLLVEFSWIVSLLASSWILLWISYFGLISFLKAICFKSIDQEGECSEKLCPCEGRFDKKGGEEKKAVKLLDERAGDHKNANHCDFQEDDASLPVEGFRHAAVKPKLICFSFEDKIVSENYSTVSPETKACREKGGDEAFSSYENKLQNAINGRFLKVRDFESHRVSPDINVGGDEYSPTDFSSSGLSNRDMFSEGDASDSSFEEDDFLTEEDFICIKSRPISDYLSLDYDQCEEPNSSDCENSDGKELEYNYDFLGQKDENYEKLESSCFRAPSLPASDKKSEEEDDDDDTSVSSNIFETSDLEAELVEVLTANENCGFILQSNQGSPDHAAADDPLCEDERNNHGWHYSEKPIPEDQIRNHIAFAKDTHHANPNSGDSSQYRSANVQNQRSPINQEQSPQGLQEDHPEDTYSSNEVNHEDENHFILGQVEDTQNHVTEEPFESTSDRNNPTIQDLLKSEDTNDGTSDSLTEPQVTKPQDSTSVGENNDNDIDNCRESISERREERRDYEDDDGHEALLEHQKMVEKLKIEMRRGRGRGLPTILEESDWPNMMDDLNQWKVDNNKLMAAAKEDPLEEMQRFYWSYTDRMRKLDVLNHQKTSSIGFLNLADPIQSGSALRATNPALTSVVSHNFRRSRTQKPEIQPSAQFMRELRVDLETVYVGQVCLSWEYLHWQYTQYRDMMDADPDYRGNFRRAANEFQTFLVLLTRFIEDEKFKGPRVDNYVKNRCVQRGLLQVPLIKEEKAGKLEGEEEDTSMDDLLEIMEECLRTFWDFVKRDGDEVGTMLKVKGLIVSQAELQEPSDAELFANIQATVQKKEKRVKDLHRKGKCLVKRFQRHHQHGGCMDESLFFSLVDMKLVGRVLRMSRVSSDHLEWCQRKLLNVAFKGRRLVRDPSLLLFPLPSS